jgi:hypothetical protein
MRWGLVNRRVWDHDIVIANSACGEEVEVLLRLMRRITDCQRAHTDVPRYQHANGAFDYSMGVPVP